jgi:hypothetical protein
VLVSPEETLADEGVSEDDVAEALRLIEAARRARNLLGLPPVVPPEGPVQDPPAPVPVPEPEPPPGPTTREEREPTDPTRTGFRFGRPVTRRGQRRKSVRKPRERRADAYIESDAETERRAVEIVRRYAEDVLHARIVDVQAERKGWDLEFVLPRDRRRLVEVKGTTRGDLFRLTRNERRAALRNPEKYDLYWVAKARSPERAEIRRFKAIGRHLRDHMVEPVQWVVGGWTGLPHEVIQVSETSDSSS